MSHDESAPVRAQAGERAGADSAARSRTHSGTHSEATGEAKAPGCVAWVRLAGWLDGRAYVVGPVWVWDAQVEYLLTALAPPGSTALAEDVEVSAAPGAPSAGHVVDVMARQPGAGGRPRCMSRILCGGVEGSGEVLVVDAAGARVPG